MAVDNHWRILFHFVAAEQADAILAAREIGFATPLNSILNGVTGRRLVWLTDTPEADVTAVLGGRRPGADGAELALVRFTVQVARAQHWAEWARRHRVPGRVRRRVTDLTEGTNPWWVGPDPIGAENWIRAEGVRSRLLLWPPTQAQTPAWSS